MVGGSGPDAAGTAAEKGRCGTMTHDYKRHRTTTLFAALNTLDGTVIGTCMPKHRHQEWKQIHLIADNYATHKHPEVQAWMAQPPRRTSVPRRYGGHG